MASPSTALTSPDQSDLLRYVDSRMQAIAANTTEASIGKIPTFVLGLLGIYASKIPLGTSDFIDSHTMILKKLNREKITEALIEGVKHLDGDSVYHGLVEGKILLDPRSRAIIQAVFAGSLWKTDLPYLPKAVLAATSRSSDCKEDLAKIQNNRKMQTLQYMLGLRTAFHSGKHKPYWIAATMLAKMYNNNVTAREGAFTLLTDRPYQQAASHLLFNIFTVYQRFQKFQSSRNEAVKRADGVDVKEIDLAQSPQAFLINEIFQAVKPALISLAGIYLSKKMGNALVNSKGLKTHPWICSVIEGLISFSTEMLASHASRNDNDAPVAMLESTALDDTK